MPHLADRSNPPARTPQIKSPYLPEGLEGARQRRDGDVAQVVSAMREIRSGGLEPGGPRSCSGSSFHSLIACSFFFFLLLFPLYYPHCVHSPG